VGSSGRSGNELRGVESVDRSNVPALMVRYLIRFWTRILYSLSSLFNTSIESILEDGDVWLILARAKVVVFDLGGSGNVRKTSRESIDFGRRD
jgi:hypothetical protein